MKPGRAPARRSGIGAAWHAVLGAIVLSVALVAPLFAQSPDGPPIPKPTGYVIDNADVIDAATEDRLQRYLDQLGALRGDAPAELIVRELLERATCRLHELCATMLRRSYPRLARPPLNLSADEMLSGVVERMLKALREQRPENVRRFFALANQHMRWELNEMARGLDERTPEAELTSDVAVAPRENSGAPPGPGFHRILDAIEQLPEEEREVFSLVRIQGMAHTEASEVLGVATKTIQRRLHRGLFLLSERLGDLVPPDSAEERA